MSELPPTGSPSGDALPEPPYEVGPPAAPFATRQIRLRGRRLREHAAHGTMINAAFMIALNALGLVRGFVLAALMTRADYGLWGVLAVALGSLLWLKQTGVGDKFIQQDELDQEHEFQKAFTLEFVFTLMFSVLMLAVLPLVAWVYDEPKLIAPGVAAVFLLPAGALTAPLWIYWRRMQFLRARLLLAIDPIVGTIVGITAAAMGAGYWAFAAAALAGAWLTAIVTVVTSPYPLRFRYDRGTLRSYASFSWPLIVAGGGGLVIAQSGVLATKLHLGLAAVGTLALANTITQFTHHVDHVVSGALYPAVCAVKDNTQLLAESFTKSNRLGLMWAVPFGFGIALFVPDLITFVIGEQWREGELLMQIFGIIAAIAHIGWNWESYYRALGETRPMAWAALAAAVAFLAVGIPLLLMYGLTGFAIGNAFQGAVHLACRVYFLKKLFRGLHVIRHATRSILPAFPGVFVVLALRAVEPDERTLLIALGEGVVYVAVTAAATWAIDGRLLREAVGYVRGSSKTAEAPA